MNLSIDESSIMKTISSEIIEINDKNDSKVEQKINGNMLNKIENELGELKSQISTNEYQLIEDEANADKINLHPIDIDSSIISTTNPNEYLMIINHALVANEPSTSHTTFDTNFNDSLAKSEEKPSNDSNNQIKRQPNIIKVPVTGESKIKTLTLKFLPPINGVERNNNISQKVEKLDNFNELSAQSTAMIKSPSKLTTKPTIQKINPAPRLIINLSNGTTTVSNENSLIKSNAKPIDQLGEKIQSCVREGCNKKAIKSEEWDEEYCSNECVIKHCKQVFNNWVKSRVKK